eukprot:gene10999-12246_t
MDCFESPLRIHHGLHAKPSHRKFIVFQPDEGGWNNIRMALEVVIVFAMVTGRILVIPPSAILYLLVLNKKWGQNKATIEAYFDFSRLRAGKGLETMPMEQFLSTIAAPGLLSLPLPKNDTHLIRKPLWNYLESACETRQWQPGKVFIGFNITSHESGHILEESQGGSEHLGDFQAVDPKRLDEFSMNKERKLWPYDNSLNYHRALFFPGHHENRLLTHYYSYLFWANPKEEKLVKRIVRDRLRYHDEIFCVASRIIERLLVLQDQPSTISSSSMPLLPRPGSLDDMDAKYVAFHIRRGDFQQKHTRLPAEEIVALTNHLVPDRKERIAYIATDEGNRSFFAPFEAEYKAIYFLKDVEGGSGIEEVNPNYVGMIEQVICAGAHTFIGTPLSTFTAYITRMRGYLNRTITIDAPLSSDKHRMGKRILDRRGIYERTYYFMKNQMYQLHTHPKVHFPLWVRDFVEVFKDIDE